MPWVNLLIDWETFWTQPPTPGCGNPCPPIWTGPWLHRANGDLGGCWRPQPRTRPQGGDASESCATHQPNWPNKRRVALCMRSSTQDRPRSMAEWRLTTHRLTLGCATTVRNTASHKRHAEWRTHGWPKGAASARRGDEGGYDFKHHQNSTKGPQEWKKERKIVAGEGKKA